jgi:hypothetical protein
MRGQLQREDVHLREHAIRTDAGVLNVAVSDIADPKTPFLTLAFHSDRKGKPSQSNK